MRERWPEGYAPMQTIAYSQTGGPNIGAVGAGRLVEALLLLYAVHVPRSRRTRHK